MIACTLLLPALLAVPQTVEVETPSLPARLAAVEAAAQAEFERQGLVGLSVAVVEGPRIVEFHFGYEDREGEVKAGPDTRYRWASISKPVTAVRALQLADAGALDLDADVRDSVPEFPEKPWPVTTRQLLSHLGGVVHYRNGEVIRTERTYETEHPFVDVVTALDTFAESPLIAEPGTRFAYTTHGFILASAVVQRAGEAPFVEQVAEHVAKPLGMTTFRPDYQWEDIPHRAVGYRKRGEEVVPSTDTDVSWKLGGGGYISTVGDLARFARGLFGTELLPAETLDVAWTPQRARGEEGERTSGYGLGFAVAQVGGKLRIGHSGSQEKTRTLMHVFPGADRAIVIMTNSEWANVGALADPLWEAFGRP